ncbi:VOC family protein [Dethiothermospora halolimnae]|uniref:VOC family protein n=1 Tax=Dethiothermospora halolimnae TaxID=3114390 RepID=UPI003CCBA582
MDFEIKINSLYICVKDMERAITFYENLFSQQVDEKSDVFSVFDLQGFRFCLFNNNEVGEKVTYGDNCLPSFEVNNMDKLISKLKELDAQLVFPLTKIKDNWVLEFRDSEDNDIEVYCKI